MLKQALIRGINSFTYSIAITLIFMGIFSCFTGYTPFLPEYLARFDDPSKALMVELLLIGVASASLGAGSIIMEMEKLSLLVQSILYFLITAVIWIIAGNYLWSIHKYPSAMLSLGLSYLVSYIICWIVQYQICKKSVEEINRKISEERKEAA